MAIALEHIHAYDYSCLKIKYSQEFREYTQHCVQSATSMIFQS